MPLKRDFHLGIRDVFLLVYVITRLLILFTPGNIFDNESFILPLVEILNGRNPYDELGIEVIVYPPLFYLLLFAFSGLFGMNTFALGACVIIFDVGTVFILYKIAGLVIEDETKRYFPIFFYAFFPLTLFVLTARIFAPMATFFFVLAIFFHLKKRPFLTGFFAGIGFQIEIFPAFLIFIYGLLFFAHKQYKKMFELVFAFVLVFFAINLPFFDFDPLKTIEIIAVHFNRSGSLSLMLSISDLAYVLNGIPPIVFYNWPNFFTIEIFSGFSIDISTMITLAGLIAFGLWVLKVGRKNPQISSMEELKILFLFFLILPIITLNIYFRTFYWSLILPGLLLAYPDQSAMRQILKKSIRGVILCLSISLIVFNLIIPNGLFLNLFADLSFKLSIFYTIPDFNKFYLLALLAFLAGLLYLWHSQWFSMIKSSRVNLISGLTPIIKMILTVSLLGMILAVAHKFNHSPLVTEIRSLVKIVLSLAGLYLLSLELYKYWTLNFPKNRIRQVALFE